MKKIILLTLISLLFVACADDEQYMPHQWVCFKSAPVMEKINIKPEEVKYVTQNDEEKMILEKMIQEKYDFKSDPDQWAVYHRCVKVTFKDGWWKASKSS